MKSWPTANQEEAMRELFIEELEEVVGGWKKPPCKCCLPSTMACCEEGECDTCCDIY
jgi:hypothetical protein